MITYNEFITEIINTRGQWGFTSEDIYEIHHIIPKCLGGLPLKLHSHDVKHPNLIWLTPAEHYTAHKLLALENPDNKKLTFAFWKISTSNNVSVEDYALAKELYIKARRETIQSEAANKKRSDTMKQHKLVWYNNGEIEIRASVCPEGFSKGRCSAIKQTISKKCKARDLHLFGEKNGMYKKHHTEETKDKIRAYSHSSHWYNNGKIEVFKPECPEGFIKGRLKKGK